MLSVPAERRCLVNDDGKLAVVSSIFLSNNGETFAALAVDNITAYMFPSYISIITTHDN